MRERCVVSHPPTAFPEWENDGPTTRVPGPSPLETRPWPFAEGSTPLSVPATGSERSSPCASEGAPNPPSSSGRIPRSLVAGSLACCFPPTIGTNGGSAPRPNRDSCEAKSSVAGFDHGPARWDGPRNRRRSSTSGPSRSLRYLGRLPSTCGSSLFRWGPPAGGRLARRPAILGALFRDRPGRRCRGRRSTPARLLPVHRPRSGGKLEGD